jgi:hypothetical protein
MEPKVCILSQQHSTPKSKPSIQQAHHTMRAYTHIRRHLKLRPPLKPGNEISSRHLRSPSQTGTNSFRKLLELRRRAMSLQIILVRVPKPIQSAMLNIHPPGLQGTLTSQ